MKKLLLTIGILLVGLITFAQPTGVSGNWSFPHDLLFINGAVLNFNSSDVTLTHSANTLTLAGGTLVLPSGTAASTEDINDSIQVYLANAEEGVAVADTLSGGIYYTQRQVDSLILTTVAYTLQSSPSILTDPVDATTYYFGSAIFRGLLTTELQNQWVLPYNCTLVGWSLMARSSAAATTEASTLSVRKNGATDLQLSNAILFNSTSALYYSGTGLTTDYAAGDKIELKLVTATWSTEPENMSLEITLFFKNK